MAPPDFRNFTFNRARSCPPESSSLFLGILLHGASFKMPNLFKPVIANSQKSRTKKRPSERYSHYTTNRRKGQGFFAIFSDISQLFGYTCVVCKERLLYIGYRPELFDKKSQFPTLTTRASLYYYKTDAGKLSSATQRLQVSIYSLCLMEPCSPNHLQRSVILWTYSNAMRNGFTKPRKIRI